MYFAEGKNKEGGRFRPPS